MKLKQVLLSMLAIAVMSVLFVASTPVRADQNSKNTWRNIGIGSAVLGVYGATHGNGGLAAAGIAGAGYSAYRYEQDRKHQSQERRRRAYYYHHHHHHAY